MPDIIFALCVYLTIRLSTVSGSVVEFNATEFTDLPPLYALDEWKQCQRPGDVYCIVDAVLMSRNMSPGLTLLQEYSKETLKHYNRTMIHRGVCVSRCGSSDNVTGSWDAAAQQCLNSSVLKYGLEHYQPTRPDFLGVYHDLKKLFSSPFPRVTEVRRQLTIWIMMDAYPELRSISFAEVMSVNWCSTVGSSPMIDTSSARALAVLCVVLVSLAFLATILHILGDRCAKTDGNRYLLAFSMKRNWQILTYDRSKPRSDARMKNIACIEGIRVFGLQSVIFSHALLIYIYSFTDNPEFIENMYDQFVWQTLLNTPLWLQAFFSMSGFLTAYTILITVDKKPMTFMKCFMGVVNRYIRLTPAAGFALWFIISWYPILGSGPQWSWMVTREAHDCSERWLYHILYVHNHLEMGKMCMGHTWYLAADMQLHIFGLILMLVLVRYRRAAGVVLPALILASALAAGLVTYFNELKPIIAGQSPEVLRTMFAGSKTLTMLYLPSWMNLPGYVGGYPLLLFFTTPRLMWFNILFHAALTLGGCVAMAGTVFLSDSPPPLWGSALYSALDRTLVALCFNVFLLGCFSNCKSGLKELVDWRGFHFLGRISYSVFLIHFIVLRLVVGGNTQLGHGSIYSLLLVLITVSVLSTIIAIPFCLLIELPAIELWKAITQSDRPERPPTAPTVQPRVPTIHTIVPNAKPMDLLTHVRRRNDV